MGKHQVRNGDRTFAVEDLFEAHIRTVQDFKKWAPAIVSLADRIVEAFKRGNKLLLFGNGGSAADAQHIAAELSWRMGKRPRKALPALALTANTSELTAIGNDFGFAMVFERLVEAHARKGDIVLALSTSGVSMNVLAGVAAALRAKCYTVAWSGRKGHVHRIADMTIAVPSDDTQRIQECHILMGHILCGLIEEQFK